MQVRIIGIKNPETWNEMVFAAHTYDFYHCHSYHLLEKNVEPILFVAEDPISESFIALPLLIREIPDTAYFDCTSAYGYPGPVSSKCANEVSAELISFFQKSLLEFFEARGIIAAFSRLHPVIDQTTFLDGIGEILPLNKTVLIDLTSPLDQQRAKYRKSNKSEINQLRRAGFVVKPVTTESEVEAFVDIYTETMKRVEASSYYFFDLNYFKSFLRAPDFKNVLLLAYKDEVVAAGAIFTVTRKIMQYHLAGTRDEFIRVAPMKLIIDEARIMANEMKLEMFHLGGGVGGSDLDPLFRFKSGFSDRFCQFNVWRFIARQDVYNDLVIERMKTNPVKPNYFPLYRG